MGRYRTEAAVRLVNPPSHPPGPPAKPVRRPNGPTSTGTVRPLTGGPNGAPLGAASTENVATIRNVVQPRRPALAGIHRAIAHGVVPSPGPSRFVRRHLLLPRVVAGTNPAVEPGQLVRSAHAARRRAPRPAVVPSTWSAGTGAAARRSDRHKACAAAGGLTARPTPADHSSKSRWTVAPCPDRSHRPILLAARSPAHESGGPHDHQRPRSTPFSSRATARQVGYVAATAALVAPIWFVLDGHDVLFTTGRDTAKGRAIARDPRVVLCVDLEEPPYAFVQVQGRAEVSEDPDELIRSATAIGDRCMGADRAEEFGRRNGAPGELLVRCARRRSSTT